MKHPITLHIIPLLPLILLFGADRIITIALASTNPILEIPTTHLLTDLPETPVKPKNPTLTEITPTANTQHQKHETTPAFVIPDRRSFKMPKYEREKFMKSCGGEKAIGGDGFVFSPTPSARRFVVLIYNNDQSEPSLFWDGIQCLALHLHTMQKDAQWFKVMTVEQTFFISIHPNSVFTLYSINPPEEIREWYTINMPEGSRTYQKRDGAFWPLPNKLRNLLAVWKICSAIAKLKLRERVWNPFWRGVGVLRPRVPMNGVYSLYLRMI